MSHTRHNLYDFRSLPPRSISFHNGGNANRDAESFQNNITLDEVEQVDNLNVYGFGDYSNNNDLRLMHNAYSGDYGEPGSGQTYDGRRGYNAAMDAPQAHNQMTARQAARFQYSQH